METIFVYGTLRSGGEFHHYLAGKRFLGIGWTSEKYTLFESKFPFCVKDLATSAIRGEAYEVDPEFLEWLDQFEEHPTKYYREKTTILLDDGTVRPAWMYFHPPDHGWLNPFGDFLMEKVDD